MEVPMAPAVVVAPVIGKPLRQSREHRFFFGLSVLIGAIVFIGFARTYFLAGLFHAKLTAGFGRWPVHFLLHRPLPAMLATFSLLLLVAVHDLRSIRRIHPATARGGTWVVLVELSAIAVGHSAAWQSFATQMHALGI